MSYHAGYEMSPNEPSASHFTSHELPATNCRSYKLREPIPRLGQAPNHSGESDPHHPITQVTSTSLKGPATGYELQELRATYPRDTPSLAYSQSHSHPIAQVTRTSLKRPVTGYELQEL